MVKYERNDTEKAKMAKISLDKEKPNGTYNTKEVNDALQEMFHRKCYLCEQKDVGSYQIEHLVPHKKDVDLKFDWNNLFLACAHCNNIKCAGYDPILDCSEVEVDKKIAFRKKGYFGVRETLEFDALEDTIEIENTVNLLYEVYYGSTPQKIAEAKMIRRAVRKEMSEFKEYVRLYEDETGEDKEDLLFEIRRSLKASAPFAAFKRWIIRDHLDHYPELEELVS